MQDKAQSVRPFNKKNDDQRFVLFQIFTMITKYKLLKKKDTS